MYCSDVVQKDFDAALAKIKKKRIVVDNGKELRLGDTVSPCPHIAMAVVEPCNIVLVMHSGLELTNLTVVNGQHPLELLRRSCTR